MVDAKATATGTFGATPLSQLLVYVLDKQLDGTFVFQTPDGARSALQVERGAPRKAKTAIPIVYLGRLLLELNAIDQDTLDRTLARMAKDKRLHGELLYECGAIDEATLEVGLGEQLIRQIEWMFKLPPETAYGFYKDVNYLERYGGEGAEIEPLNAIWRGIRYNESPDRVESTVARLGSRPIALHYMAQIARFGFSGPDRALLDVIRAKQYTLDELMMTGLSEESQMKRVVYALMISRHLDVGAEPVGIHTVLRAPSDTDNTARRFRKNVQRRVTPEANPVVVSAPPPVAASAKPAAIPSPPVSRSPVPSARPDLHAPPSARPAAPVVSNRPAAGPVPSARPESQRAGNVDPAQMAALCADIEELKVKMPSQNYYEILGVAPDTPTSGISASFFQLAKRFHPDRLGRESAAIREDAMKIFARMTEAHQVLTDPSRRRDYDEVLNQGGGTSEEQEQVNRVMRAVIAHQKAQVLFKKQNFVEAEKLAREAMEGDPDQPDYVAMYVRVVVAGPEVIHTARYDELLKLMKQAVDNDPENERVRFARGELYKHMGKKDEAARDFRWCVARNPRNVDAAREVRLHAIRAGEKPPEVGVRRRSMRPGEKPDKPGLLGKFFKR